MSLQALRLLAVAFSEFSWGGADCCGSIYFKFSFMKSDCFRCVLACVYLVHMLTPDLLSVTGPLQFKLMEIHKEGGLLGSSLWAGDTGQSQRGFGGFYDVTHFIVSRVGIR